MSTSYKHEIYTSGGWLTSYKRKLYMGRTIEWNQMLNKSKYPATKVYSGVTYTNNGDGTITLNGTATAITNYSLQSGISVVASHKYFCDYSHILWGGSVSILLYSVESGVFNNAYPVGIQGMVTALKDYDKVYFQIKVNKGATVTNLLVKPQMFDLTKMFGSGNEPSTPAEFWSYFDHKLYPYNAGEVQPLFKISRKSLIK